VKQRRNIEAAMEDHQITYKGRHIRVTVYFSTKLSKGKEGRE
jgi:hypothetical protein